MALNPWYVTGLADGEGSFTFSRAGRNLALYFGLKLTGADQHLLEELRDFFDVGTVYPVKAARPRSAAQGYTKAAFYYRATRLHDLGAIVDHFERYPLQGCKRHGFQIWAQMYRLKMAHYRRPPLDQLQALATALSASSARSHAWVPDLTEASPGDG